MGRYGVIDRVFDAVAVVLGGLALPGAFGFALPEALGPVHALTLTPPFATYPVLILLCAASILGVKYKVWREREKAAIRSVGVLATPSYDDLDPEDPMVKRLIKDRIEEKSSFENVDIVDVVDEILSTAVFLGASDVHCEAKARRCQLNYRVDGVLTEIAEIPKPLHAGLVNRVKIMSHLDISVKNTPQDGRVQSRIRGRNYNMRVSAFPTLHGETLVIRILGSGRKLFNLDEFGVQEEVLENFRKLLHSPQGILLFTGPTGSGKSSLMYAGLRDIIKGGHMKKNICTLEDPIEQELDEINQAQIDPRKGVTFAVALRALLRQDPDVIMVGEIRDLETAQIALQAGQTGHLILTTVHANSAAGAFARLLDMGLEPFLLSSALTGIVAQRLVRRLCSICRVEVTAAQDRKVPSLGKSVPSGLPVFGAKGCDACNGTGYDGRMAVFEFLRVTEAISDAVMKKATTRDLVRVARQEGMFSLLEDGLVKVGQGATSLNEIDRVVSA